MAPPQWNLAASFAAPEPAQAADCLRYVVAASRAFGERHGGDLAVHDPARLAAALGALEDLLAPLQRLTTWAELVLAERMDDADAADLLDRCDEAWAAVTEAADGVEVAIAALPDDHDEGLLADPALTRYAHHVATIRATAHLRPPPGTGDVLRRLEPVTLAGWERLARQLLARLEVHDGTVTLGLGAALPALYDGDRDRRHRLSAAVSSALEAEVELRATVLSMAARARVLDAELRGLPDWLHPTHVADDVTAREVAALLEAVAAHRPLAHRYYRAKAGLTGSRLTDADRYAPVGQPPPLLTWPECRDLALDALAAVAGELADAARDLLDNGAVDAAPRPGKRRGALTFSAPGVRPHVLLNFTGQARDVLTTAHELAHAAHASLAGHHGPLTAAVPRVLAETVALFAETVAARRLTGAVGGEGARLFVLARRIEDQLVAVFREAALHDFDLAVHAAAAQDVLDADALGDLWTSGQAAVYGDAVELGPGYRHWWSYLESVFLAPGTRYAYVYGQLAALALLARHDDDPRRFGARLVGVLREAGTRSPASLLASLGIDVATPAGWQLGLDMLRDEVDQLDELAAHAAPGAHASGPGQLIGAGAPRHAT